MKTLLIANRGEIACRIIRTAKSLGLRTVAVFSDADVDALHVRSADVAIHIGESPAARSYLQGERIVSAALEAGADAVHPGYGFLSENADFAQAVEAAGLTWVGPDPVSIAVMSDKHAARVAAIAAGLPVLPGSGRLAGHDAEGIDAAGKQVGFPLLVKATGGGGGIGMQRVDSQETLHAIVASTQGVARRLFGDGAVFLERFVENARHIEVQVFGFGEGRAIHLFERECSIQRRFQKVIEESPSPALDVATRRVLTEAACNLARSQRYRGAGTVEFIYDDDTRAFYFLEMNTRIQVEHPVTEMITGID